MDDDEVECLLATMIYKVRHFYHSFCSLSFIVYEAAVAFRGIEPRNLLRHYPISRKVSG